MAVDHTGTRGLMGVEASDPVRRILLLARGGPIGGSQRQVGYLARGLDRRRFEPIVVLDQPGPTAEDLRSSGIDVHVIRMRKWRSIPDAFLRYRGAFRIAALGARRGVDLVHASDLWRSGYAHFAARRLGVPCVLHVRGPISERDISKHRVARAAAAVTIARRYQEDLLAAGIPSQRLSLIDDSVDLQQFRPDLPERDAVRRELGVEGRIVVGLVGRVEPFKRVVEFLEAIAPLTVRNDRRAAYLVIGPPAKESYLRTVLQTVQRLGLSQHVRFVGQREDMPATIAGLDILVTMSGGSVMFEGMACAKPVLSVRTDRRHSEHTRDGETALCVTTDRPEPATKALARLIDEADLREQLGRAARTWAEQHLSPATMVARTGALYDSLLRR